LKEWDPLDRPVSTEFRSPWGDPRAFSLPAIAFTQVAAYDSNGLMNTFRARAATFERYNKPLLLEEYGGHSMGGSRHWIAQQLHDGPWAAWVLNVSGSPMPWWWSFIFTENLDRHFARFAAFIRGEDLSVRTWTCGPAALENAPALAAHMRTSADRAFVWIYKTDLVDVVAPAGRNGWWSHAWRTMGLYDQNRGAWDPLAQEAMADQFSCDGAVLRLNGKGLKPGRWRYECWDTWTDAPPLSGDFTLTADAPTLPLPPLRRDAALKLVRQGD